jgi:hypothetical protein
MSLRRISQACAGALALLLTVGASGSLPASGLAAAGPVATNCAVRHVLVLMDQSGSLRQTDPHQERVNAAQELVTSLAATANQPGAVSITIAGFDAAYEELGTHALPQGAPDAQRQLDEFRQRDRGVNTDYVAALLGASRHFAGIAAPPGCKTLVWFTDGAHDIEVPTAGEAATYSSLIDSNGLRASLAPLVCGPLPDTSLIASPVSEMLRNAGVDVRLSELRTGAADARTRELQANTDPVLNDLFTPGTGCSVTGAREQVNGADQLGSSFFRQTQGSLGATELACDLLTANGVPVDAVRAIAYRSPSGAPVRVRAGAAELARTATTFATVPIPDSARDGGGALTLDGPATDCFAQLDVAVQLASAPTLFRRATKRTVDVVVARPGHPQSAGLSDAIVRMGAEVGGHATDIRWNQGRHVWTLVVPTDATAAKQQTVDLTAIAAPASGDGVTSIPALHTPLTLTDLPPRPGVRWDGPDHIEGDGVTAGAMVFGPTATVPDAQLCISLATTSLVLNDANGTAVGTVAPDSGAERCTPFELGGEVRVPVEITIPEARNATARPSVPFRARLVAPGDVEDLGEASAEPVTLTLTRPADLRRESMVFAVLLLTTAVVPLLVLWLITAWQSRLVDPQDFLAAELPLSRVTGNGTPGRPGAAREVTFERAGELEMSNLRPVTGKRSRWNLPGGGSLARRVPANPFGTPSAILTYPASRVLIPGRRDQRLGAPGRVAVRFESVTAVVVDATGGPAEPRAIVVVALRSTAASAQAKVDEALRWIRDTDAPEEPPTGSPVGIERPVGPSAPSASGNGDGRHAPPIPPARPARPAGPPPIPPRPTGPPGPRPR